MEKPSYKEQYFGRKKEALVVMAGVVLAWMFTSCSWPNANSRPETFCPLDGPNGADWLSITDSSGKVTIDQTGFGSYQSTNWEAEVENNGRTLEIRKHPPRYSPPTIGIQPVDAFLHRIDVMHFLGSIVYPPDISEVRQGDCVVISQR